jgi:hypothetical protein
MIRKWLTENHKFVMRAALAGEPTPGLKPVAGRAPARIWLKGSEDKAAEILVAQVGEKDAYTKKLLSPAQAQELLPKPVYEQLIPFVDKRETEFSVDLVRESSKKPRLMLAEDMLDDDDVFDDEEI